MKFWYFSFDTLCFASSFILPYPTGAPLTLWEMGSPSPVGDAARTGYVFDTASALA
ncbi:hypothetical protein [Scytonema sp. PCC 10023]|uniref:hypothetical protein n=1 Tax=Scytonema sp. PCC 10023 TaxID=1680591 RepID=UPI0039C65BF3